MPSGELLKQAFMTVVESTSTKEITVPQDLKKALQLAGFSPSDSEVLKHYNVIRNISYDKFCEIAGQLTPFSAEDIVHLISQVVETNDGIFKWKQLQNALQIEFETEMFGLNELSKKNGIDLSIDANLFASHITNQIVELERIFHKSNSDKKMKRTLDNHIESNGAQKDSWLNWNSSSMKGCFYAEKNSIIAHQYHFHVTYDGLYTICIKATPMLSQKHDLLAFIFQESAGGTRLYHNFTDKTQDYLNYCETKLTAGKYFLIVFTSGCQLQQRKNLENEKPINLIEPNGKYSLTTVFKKILKDIFNQIDLNSNNLLDRQEFNLYNWRTSGEVVQDDEWNIVLQNFSVENGELTEEGFISLHQMEAEHNSGDTQDIWLSLHSMGFDIKGKQTSALPFVVSIYAKLEPPKISVSGLRSGGVLLDRALIKSVIDAVKPKKIGPNSCCLLFVKSDNHYGCVVLQNIATHNIKCDVDCSESLNCLSDKGNLKCEVVVNAQSAVCAHFLIPKTPLLSWKIYCKVTVSDTE